MVSRVWGATTWNIVVRQMALPAFEWDHTTQCCRTFTLALARLSCVILTHAELKDWVGASLVGISVIDLLQWAVGFGGHGCGCTWMRKQFSLSWPRVLKEITVPYGLRYDGLKPVPFIGFEIPPPGRACIQELWDQGCTSYVPQCISVEPISADGL